MLLILGALGPLPARAAEPAAKAAPSWLTKTIVPEGAFIYAVGRSGVQKNEKEAKDLAVVDATAQFVKYCGVSVEAFSRSIEVYSKENSKEYASSDVQAQSRSRAKAFVSRAIPEEWHLVKGRKDVEAWVLLKVPKEEFDRIVKEKNVKLSLDVLFYYEDDDKKMKTLTDGSVLKSGDGYALYVRPSDDSHIYVFQVDGLGKSFRLFPNAEFKTAANPVPAAADLWIPGEENLYTLDETTGKERFFLFASPDAIPEFEGTDAAGLSVKDLDAVVSLKKMGMAGVRVKRDPSQATPPKRENDVVAVKRKLQADGAFVYETWFWHK